MKSEQSIAVLAFVPVIHRGYVDFFASHKGDIFVFGDDIVITYIHLTRDLRAIKPVEAVTALQSIFPQRKIRALSLAEIANWSYDKICMPDDEVCRDLSAKYFSNKEVEFVPVFLRWNKIITFKENEVPAHRKITTDEFHREMIALADKEAQKSSDWWRQIAACVVKDGKITFVTHNHHMPTDFHLSVNGDPRSNFDAGQHQEIFTSIHAEAEAVARAAKEGVSLEGATCYVTTFPCPNCARLLGTAGIKRIYYSKGYSLLDAEQILDSFGVEITLVR